MIVSGVRRRSMCARLLAFGSAGKDAWHRITARPSPAVETPPWKTDVAANRRTVSTRSNGRFDVCTLDCTGTIMRIKGSIPRLYLGVLEDRLGIEEGALPGVSERGLLTSFGKSLKQRSREVPCFGSGRMSSEEWWGEVVRATFIGAGIKENDLDGVFAEVFEELFHEVFTGEAAWELVPGANDVIGDLRAWCNEADGPRALGVISNFDERLHPLLKTLRVYDSFDFVLTSRECGSEKPSPLMFSEALKRAGAPPHDISVGVHIGDTFSRDIIGARSAGWEGILITARDQPSDEERDVEHTRVRELVDVPNALGVNRMSI